MLEKLKNQVTNPEFVNAVKKIAINVVTTVVVATAVKVITYVAIEGTKSLVNEITKQKDQPSE